MQVDIFIPIFKSHKTLRKCLDCIVVSQKEGIEIKLFLIINGESAASYATVLQDLRVDYELITLKQANRSSARNSALKLGASEFIIFLDSDVYLSALAITKLCELMKKLKFDAIQGLVKPSGADNFLNQKRKIIFEENKRLKLGAFNSSFFMMKRSVFETCQFDPKFLRCEDTDFYLQLLNQRKKVYFFNQVLGEVEWTKGIYNYVVKRQFEQGFYSALLMKKYDFISKDHFKKQNIFWNFGFRKGEREQIEFSQIKRRNIQWPDESGQLHKLSDDTFYYFRDLNIIFIDIKKMKTISFTMAELSTLQDSRGPFIKTTILKSFKNLGIIE